MTQFKKIVQVAIDGLEKHQTVDGFGVNINSRYWNGGRLIPAMDLLVEDLGATLFRMDAWGKSDWVDPEGRFGPSVLNAETYARVYASEEFRNAAEMGRYLNARGIEPYVTLSGVVPKWMCGADGRTLTDFDSFAEMAASYAEWLRKDAGVAFTLFGPLNETDLGPPEGPLASPEAYARACEALVDRLDARGLGGIRLVAAEQSNYDLGYFEALTGSPKLRDRVAVIGMHAYGDYHCDGLVRAIGERGLSCRAWMTEYGDLDQTGEKEWFVAWQTFQRLMRLMEDGMTGALNWDAFDNYHDHDGCWTIYGLLRAGLRLYTPKKRYYACRQAYRFIRPGFVRVGAASGCGGLPVLAFANGDGTAFTLIGRNESDEGAYLNVRLRGLSDCLKADRVDVYHTTEELDCVKTASPAVTTGNWPFDGIEVSAPPRSIFTVTTVR